MVSPCLNLRCLFRRRPLFSWRIVRQVSPGRFAPNLDSRLYWEDIPYGLCVLKSLAGGYGVGGYYGHDRGLAPSFRDVCPAGGGWKSARRMSMGVLHDWSGAVSMSRCGVAR